jgi:hypothetical protein
MARKQKDLICIDEDKSLVFSTENELYEHFKTEISTLEEEFYTLRQSGKDVSEKQFGRYDKNLQKCLDNPDEIWKTDDSLPNSNCSIYIRLVNENLGIFHVALVYTAQDLPTFVYLHFPTKDEDLIERYRRGYKVYDRYYANAPMGSIDGDALMESDPLAIGLFEAMVKLRGEHDIPLTEFGIHSELRDPSIQEADEIWRTNDSMGNTLVTFIKDFTEEQSAKLFYVVVTIEDPQSNSHTLLFSFPSTDETLVQRYRHGENLQAEEVTQESSH